MMNRFTTCGAEGPCDLDPRTERLVPKDIDGSFVLMKIPRELVWKELAEMLDTLLPRALGVLLPQSTQLHWYAYREARLRAIPFAPAPTANPSALSGIMQDVPIEVVVAEPEAARIFAEDATRTGIIQNIKGWLIVGAPEHGAFNPPSGIVRFSRFPWM